jgi:hypothetical protein
MFDSWRNWGFLERWRERRELRWRIAEELRFHLEEAAAANVAQGMTRQDARSEAAARLGNPRAVIAECAGIEAEDRPSDSLQARRVRRFALVAASIAAPPALLLLLLAHHIRRLPVVDPSSLSVSRHPVSDAFALALQAPEQAAAFRRVTATLRTPAVESSSAGFAVSPAFFRLQRVEPALGSLTDASAGCVVLSHHLWKKRFESDHSVIGRAVEVAGAARTVCAVTPPHYWFLQRSRLFWLIEAADRKNAGGFLLIRSKLAAEPILKPEDSVSLSVASRGPLSAASVVFLAALALLAVLGLFETVGLARTLDCRQRSIVLLLRNYAFLLAKALPPLAILAILWTVVAESPALAAVGYFAGVWSLIVFYLFALLSTAAVRYALVDQRSRCPVCQRSLCMPVDLGVPGSILFDLPAVEYICAYGHGTLYLPEPTSEGVRLPAWRPPTGWWDELLGTSAPSGGTPT